MDSTVERLRLAEAYLDGGDPLQAPDMLAPLHDDLDGQAADQLLLARAYYHSAQLGRAQATLENLVELDLTRPLRPVPARADTRTAKQAR
jgi:hypothetical protein